MSKFNDIGYEHSFKYFGDVYVKTTSTRAVRVRDLEVVVFPGETTVDPTVASDFPPDSEVWVEGTYRRAGDLPSSAKCDYAMVTGLPSGVRGYGVRSGEVTPGPVYAAYGRDFIPEWPAAKVTGGGVCFGDLEVGDTYKLEPKATTYYTKTADASRPAHARVFPTTLADTRDGDEVVVFNRCGTVKADKRVILRTNWGDEQELKVNDVVRVRIVSRKMEAPPPVPAPAAKTDPETHRVKGRDLRGGETLLVTGLQLKTYVDSRTGRVHRYLRDGGNMQVVDGYMYDVISTPAPVSTRKRGKDLQVGDVVDGGFKVVSVDGEKWFRLGVNLYAIRPEYEYILALAPAAPKLPDATGKEPDGSILKRKSDGKEFHLLMFGYLTRVKKLIGHGEVLLFDRPSDFSVVSVPEQPSVKVGDLVNDPKLGRAVKVVEVTGVTHKPYRLRDLGSTKTYKASPEYIYPKVPR